MATACMNFPIAGEFHERPSRLCLSATLPQGRRPSCRLIFQRIVCTSSSLHPCKRSLRTRLISKPAGVSLSGEAARSAVREMKHELTSTKNTMHCHPGSNHRRSFRGCRKVTGQVEMMESGRLEAREPRATKNENSTAAVCSAVPWLAWVRAFFFFRPSRASTMRARSAFSPSLVVMVCRCDPQKTCSFIPENRRQNATFPPSIITSHTSHINHVAPSSLNLTLPPLDASNPPSLACIQLCRPIRIKLSQVPFRSAALPLEVGRPLITHIDRLVTSFKHPQPAQPSASDPLPDATQLTSHRHL